MERNREGHWLLLIETEDRPGAAAAIAMTFSGRGIQIESFIGYGDPAYSAGRREGIIVITFLAFAHRMEMVRRVLQRLEAVRSVVCYDYAHDARLVKTATVQLTRWDDQVRSLLEGFELTAVRVGDGRPVVVLSGRPVEVDRAAAVLCDHSLLVHAAYAFLPPARDDQAG